MIHAYVRISIGDDDEKKDKRKSVSLEYQEEDIERAFGSKYPGYMFHREVASAVKNDRPVWETLVKLLRPGDVVLAWSVDRLMRNIHDLPVISDQLDSGVLIETVKDGKFTKEEFLIFCIKGSMAAAEPRRYKERQDSRYRSGIARGEWYFQVPLGLKRGKDGKIEHNPDTSYLIPMLFRGYLAHNGGMLSYLPTANQILAAHGRTMNKTSLHQFLTNEKYISVLRYRGEESINTYPALIPLTLFNAVKRKLNGGFHHSTMKHFHLYKGLIKCECGRVLTGGEHKGRVYYYCHNAKCSFTSLREDKIDEIVSDFLHSYSFTQKGAETFLKIIRDQKKEQHDIVSKKRIAAQNTIIKNEQVLSGIIEMKAAGEIDEAMFAKKKEELMLKIRAAKFELDSSNNETLVWFEKIEKMLELLKAGFLTWDSGDKENRTIILKLLCLNFSVGVKKPLKLRLPSIIESFFKPTCTPWWS